MKWTTMIAAGEATVTSLILIISPNLFSHLVFGAELSESGQALGRLTGIVLLGFGLACWPQPRAAKQFLPAIRALAIYNSLATIYLLYLAMGGQLVGLLLWPAIVMHAILAIVIGCSWLIPTWRCRPS